jgi:hypothetical protein
MEAQPCEVAIVHGMSSRRSNGEGRCRPTGPSVKTVLHACIEAACVLLQTIAAVFASLLSARVAPLVFLRHGRSIINETINILIER